MKDVPRAADAPAGRGPHAAPADAASRGDHRRRPRRAPAAAAPRLPTRRLPVAPASRRAGVPVGYLDPAAPWAASVGGAAGGTRLRAFLAARVDLRFDDTTAASRRARRSSRRSTDRSTAASTSTSETVVDYDDRDLGAQPPAGATYVLPRVL